MKNRFKEGDQIVQKKYDKVIQKGIIVKGPFVADKVDHYQVKWTWMEKEVGVSYWKNIIGDTDLICDIPSTKYRYDLA